MAIERMTGALRRRAVETQLLTTDYDGDGERFSPDARASLLHRLRPAFFARKWSDTYTFAPAMIGWMLRNGAQFDLIHIHALFSFSATLSAAYAIARRKPFVVRPLGTLAEYGLKTRRSRMKRFSLALIERPMLARASAVHCTSEAERLDVLATCPSANAVVIPLSVEIPRRLDVVVGIVEAGGVRPLRVLYLSRLDTKKNVDVLLNALVRVVASRPTVEVVIAGDGDARYVESLKSLADRLCIADHIQWLGHVSGEEKARAFRTADVFVLPSQSENFGIAVAEALAAGLPCVVSPGVAIAPDIERYGAGLVVPPEPIPLANALTSLLEQPAQRAACARAARQLAQDEYSDEKLGARLLNLYQKILADSAARRSR